MKKLLGLILLLSSFGFSSTGGLVEISDSEMLGICSVPFIVFFVLYFIIEVVEGIKKLRK